MLGGLKLFPFPTRAGFNLRYVLWVTFITKYLTFLRVHCMLCLSLGAQHRWTPVGFHTYALSLDCMDLSKPNIKIYTNSRVLFYLLLLPLTCCIFFIYLKPYLRNSKTTLQGNWGLLKEEATSSGDLRSVEVASAVFLVPVVSTKTCVTVQRPVKWKNAPCSACLSPHSCLAGLKRKETPGNGKLCVWGKKNGYGDAHNALQLQEHRLSYNSASDLAKLGFVLVLHRFWPLEKGTCYHCLSLQTVMRTHRVE